MRMMRILVLFSFVFFLSESGVAQNKPTCVIEVEQATVAAETSKDYSQAIAKADECVRKNPKSVEAQIARAGTYAAKGDFELAIADVNKAVERSPRSADVFYSRGMVYDKRARNTFLKDEAASKVIRKEASEAAYADFDKALELDPKKGEALMAKTNLRRYFMGSGFLSLLPEYNRSIEILSAGGNTNALAEAYYERGNVYSLEYKYDLAIADFTTAIKIRPDYLAPYLLRATVHSSPFFNPKRNVDAAIADYTQVITLKPSGYTYSLRGQLYEEKNETAKAIADYRATLALDPSNFKAKERLSKLAPQTQTVTAPKPGQPTAESFAAEGRRQLSQKKYDEAIKSLSECLRLKPDAAACFAFRGYAYGMKGDLNAANSDHQAAIKQSPKEAAIYFVRGMMFVELGKKTEAIAEFRNTLKLDPSNKQAQSELLNLGVQPN